MIVTQAKKELIFREPVVEDREWAAPLLEGADALACEYSFTTLYMWRRHYHNCIAREGETLYIRSGEHHHSYLLPVGGDRKTGIDRLWEHARAQGESLVLYGAGTALIEQLEEWYPGAFSIESSPNDFDYLYNSSDLAELPGKKYHQKRNHISAFTRDHPWSYEALDDENTPEVIALAEEWCRQKGNCQDQSLRSENCAIREALRLRRELHITGGLIRVEGRPAAFTFGSPISGEAFDVHVEKALAEYGAAYTVINKEFASRELTSYRYINRENDLGIEGLRRAKQSYRPAIVLEKYVCREK